MRYAVITRFLTLGVSAQKGKFVAETARIVGIVVPCLVWLVQGHSSTETRNTWYALPGRG
jgi:hypothetical protein